MASIDPRKLRPAAESGQAGYDAEDDPLVELARIVSEDSGFSGRRTERAQPRRAESATSGQSPSELEAELLRELESTFAAQPAPPPTPRPAPAASLRPAPETTAQAVPQSRPVQPQRPLAVAAAPIEPPAPAPRAEPVPAFSAPRNPVAVEPAPIEAELVEEPESEELLRSIEEQLGQFERRARTSQPRSVEEEFGQAFETSPQEPDSPEEWRPKRRRAGGDPDAHVHEPIRAIASAEASRSDYRFRGPAREQSREPASETREEGIAFRRVEPKPPLEVVPAASRARAEELADPLVQRARRDPPAPVKFPKEARRSLQEENDAVRAAPAIAADLGEVEAEISRELEPRYADPTFAGRRKQPAPEQPRSASVAAAREQIGRSAGRATPRKQRGGFRKALLTAASVLVVAALGAAAAVYLRSGEQVSSGPPPVIAAPEGAMKVAAPEQQATADTETPGEAVYNRVAGNAPTTEEHVVESAEEPREIARIVLPSQAESDDPLVRQVGEGAPAADEASAANDAGALPDEIGPRRVQTFVVRPDGTVVTTEEAGVRADPVAAQQEQLAAQTEQIEPVPVATVAIGDPPSQSDEGTPATIEPALALAPPATEQPVAPAAEQPALAAPAPPPSEPDAPATEPAAPIAEPAVTAAVAPPAELPAPTAAAGEGYVVQVSSQRSRDQAEAAFADLQQRYGSVLGGLNGSVQEADLGEKGIYYRVRVGPWSNREEAVTVCEALQGAGGTCFVTQ